MYILVEKLSELGDFFIVVFSVKNFPLSASYFD